MTPDTKRTGPSVKRHSSRGDYQTPRDFLDAVERRFGPIAFDLAASKENRVCRAYYGIDTDSLKTDWTTLGGVAWCNPPFDPIEPWLEKCGTVRDRAGWTLLLAPASVSTEWYVEHAHGKALVLPLRPRLTFVGETDPYPRDLALFAYGFGVSGVDPWRWRENKVRQRKMGGARAAE